MEMQGSNEPKGSVWSFLRDNCSSRNWVPGYGGSWTQARTV